MRRLTSEELQAVRKCIHDGNANVSDSEDLLAHISALQKENEELRSDLAITEDMNSKHQAEAEKWWKEQAVLRKENEGLREALEKTQSARTLEGIFESAQLEKYRELLAEVESLRQYKRRMDWLHDCGSGTTDKEGCEWGIYRVKWVAGKAVEVWQTNSDFSDLDSAIEASSQPQEANPDCNLTTEGSDRAAAMEVLERCAQCIGAIEVQFVSVDWWCVMSRIDKDHYKAEFAETLPLAIAKFARQLFAKENER